MTRTFEIIPTTGTRSRLTITPTRVTVKLLPGEPDADRLVQAAHKIADVVNNPLSLRGTFDTIHNIVLLGTKSRRITGEYFMYDFNGQLITDRKPLTSNELEV